MVNHRPGSAGLGVESVGAKRVAGGPRAGNEVLGAAKIQVHLIDPITITIRGAELEGMPLGLVFQPLNELGRVDTIAGNHG